LGELIASLEKLGRGGGTAAGGGERQLKRASVNKAVNVSKPLREALPSSPVPSETSIAATVKTPERAAVKKTPEPNEALAEDSNEPNEASKNVPAQGTKTVSGLLKFVKSTDMLIYNRLDASVLSIVGDSLTITSKAENVNFLKLVKKDALLKICRDYFTSHIRLNFEKGNVPASSQKQPKDDIKTASPKPPTPPAYEEGEMASMGGEPEVVVKTTDPVPEAAKQEKAKEKAPEKASLDPKADPVLNDALFTLGGEVIS
jgi:hypothetical protein